MRVEGVRDDDSVLGEQVILPLQVSVSSVVGRGWPRVFSEIQLSSFGFPQKLTLRQRSQCKQTYLSSARNTCALWGSEPGSQGRCIMREWKFPEKQ